MKETRNILGWLGMAEHHAIMGDAGKHVDETCKTVAFLAEAVAAMVKGDLNAKSVAIENVSESERAADKLVSRMVDQLYEGLLLPPDREDLLRFAKALDKIADLTNSAARLLWLIEERLPDTVLKNISANTELIVSGVSKLREAIRAMGRNEVKNAIEFCKEVERVEHQADDHKRELMIAILHAELPPPSLLLCYNLAEGLESVTDKVETASDIVRQIAVKSR